VRSGREPAHIGEALPADLAAGNPEGSPSDPVTTDPKGEADRADAICNTPALSSKWEPMEALIEQGDRRSASYGPR